MSFVYHQSINLFTYIRCGELAMAVARLDWLASYLPSIYSKEEDKSYDQNNGTSFDQNNGTWSSSTNTYPAVWTQRG